MDIDMVINGIVDYSKAITCMNVYRSQIYPKWDPDNLTKRQRQMRLNDCTRLMTNLFPTYKPVYTDARSGFVGGELKYDDFSGTVAFNVCDDIVDYWENTQGP